MFVVKFKLRSELGKNLVYIKQILTLVMPLVCLKDVFKIFFIN